VRLAVRRSAVVLAATEDTAQRLRRLGVKDVRVFSQVGSPKEEISHLAHYKVPDSSPVRFISMGRLLHWKGFHLGLRALRSLSSTGQSTGLWEMGRRKAAAKACPGARNRLSSQVLGKVTTG
jgi:hypothetical protein